MSRHPYILALINLLSLLSMMLCAPAHSKGVITFPWSKSVSTSSVHMPSRKISTNSDNASSATSCLQCHAMAVDQNFSHYPASRGMCLSCHDVQPSHTDGTNTPGSATTRDAEHSCNTCHTARVDQQPHVHQALTAGRACSNCHEPHGSARRFLMPNNTKAVCTSCHQVSHNNSQSIHGPINSEQSCLSCHSPHSSRESHLLNTPLNGLCFNCHDRPLLGGPAENPRVIENIKNLVTNMPSIHAPARTGEGCISCHNSHSSQYEGLLTRRYPFNQWFVGYEPGNATTPNTYALCLNCHSNILNQNPNPRDTNFRNDTRDGRNVNRRNLHRLHVVELRSGAQENLARSCFVCHNAHGADQPHLIHSRVRFGPPLELQIEFRPQPNGGQCTKSCHLPVSYNRIN